MANSASSFNDENFDSNIENSGGNDSDHAKLLLATTKDSSEGTGKSRVLAFKNKAPAPMEGYQNSLKVLYSSQTTKKEVTKSSRHISSAPVRILDAPDMLDDYCKLITIYLSNLPTISIDLNLLAWSSNNVLAVALSQCVYLWNAASGDIKELMNVDTDPNDYISSVSWIQQGGSHIAIGTANNTVQLWDVQAGRQVRSLDGHSSRVGALAWNNHILSSGSRDNTVINHDVRQQQHIVGRMTHHTQEVCGLAWSPDGSYLASGSNDNTVRKLYNNKNDNNI